MMKTTETRATATPGKDGRDDQRWSATVARDGAADALFVYAVRSTGIYCRPSCPSRKPARRHVAFYSTPEAAERAGYRPCRRCRPQDGPSDDARVRIVREACRYIEAHFGEPFSLTDIVREVGGSRHRLLRAFNQIAGMTPREYADARRLDGFKSRLREGDSVTRALYDAGYGSSSRVYERAQARLGMTPGTYRRGGAGMQIHYTITDGRIGRLLVAGTPRGVCAIYLGDADAPLEGALRREYPAATIQREDEGLEPWLASIRRHLEGRRLHLDLPTDVRATAFQHRVWQELRAIPYGETRSYEEIAGRIGAPRAARAVGRACATNPLSILVPCHRAVRRDGAMGGYRWGIERKERLLEHERRVAAKASRARAV